MSCEKGFHITLRGQQQIEQDNNNHEQWRPSNIKRRPIMSCNLSPKFEEGASLPLKGEFVTEEAFLEERLIKSEEIGVDDEVVKADENPFCEVYVKEEPEIGTFAEKEHSFANFLCGRNGHFNRVEAATNSTKKQRATISRKRNCGRRFKCSECCRSLGMANRQNEVEVDILQKHLFSEEEVYDSDVNLNYDGESDLSSLDTESDPESMSSDGATSQDVKWSDVNNQFHPRKSLSARRPCSILRELTRNSCIVDIFMKQFPYSLFIHMASCTNQRLKILEGEKGKSITMTNASEMMSFVGCLFVICYNRLPEINCYWSTHRSMGNEFIKSTFARDRFKLLMSKLYIANPEKPDSADKLYYVRDVVSCLKSTFQKYRQDSPFQSIDESMNKFKGSTILRQYLPIKSVKKGVKIWMRCDALTGYTFDMNVYSGKERNLTVGTLGERVVKKLVSTIKEKDVTLLFDNFITSVHLIDKLEFASVGICMEHGTNMPQMAKQLKKGEAEFKRNGSGTLAARWVGFDVKEVHVLSNCHTNTMTKVRKTLKDGSRVGVNCPDAILFYRQTMGSVDLADQMYGCYDLDRKSLIWWKKVFYRLVMFSAVNSWIIYKELHEIPRMPLQDFLIGLAESLVEKGQKNNPVRRSLRSGRRTKRAKIMQNVGSHLPVEGKTRRRCAGCARKGIEKRTKTMCISCNLPYCKTCFTPCHA